MLNSIRRSKLYLQEIHNVRTRSRSTPVADFHHLRPILARNVIRWLYSPICWEGLGQAGLAWSGVSPSKLQW